MSDTCLASSWSSPLEYFPADSPNDVPALATACGTLYMIWPPGYQATGFWWTSFGNDLTWKPPSQVPMTNVLSGIGQPALISSDEVLYAFIPVVKESGPRQMLVYSLDPSKDTDWSHLCDYDCANIDGVAGVIHQDMVVLVLCITPVQGDASMSCIIMSPEDIGNPENWNTTVKIGGVPGMVISVFASKTDPSDTAKSSVRLVYSEDNHASVIEMVLDMQALTWYSSPRHMPAEQPCDGVTATASPDGAVTWVNFLTETNSSNSGAGVIFNNSLAPSIHWTDPSTYEGDDYCFLPWTMTYLYGDLIAVWPSHESIGWTIYRPGGTFDLTCWMKTIPDGYLVSELSIPGTHASATSSDLTFFTGKHSVERRQNMNIIQQLNAGVRFLHLIVGISDEMGSQTLSLYTQGLALINYDLTMLIQSLCDWLAKHSSEGIILFFSPLNPGQNPTAIANALNAIIATSITDFVPTASAPMLDMSQLRGKILIMHTLNPSGSSSTAVSAGIDLGTSYPDPIKAAGYNQIKTLTTESGIQFVVQDYAGASVNSPSDAATKVEAKKTLVNMMLSNTAATGTAAPQASPSRYPPQQASTWFLNWMNFMAYSSDPSTENGSLITAKSINSMVTKWLEAQNCSKSSTDWWPRVGIVISDFSELTDGTLISRIVSMNGSEYTAYTGSGTIPPYFTNW
ncbi:phosphatidylinositol-specific phospholipase [Fusarium bulbicola]|nr:phosphatidylinositol-specific phospholipase [Fusarium bulbicola]